MAIRQRSATQRNASCRGPSLGEYAQMLTKPMEDRTATAARTGQLVAMASCCQRRFIRDRNSYEPAAFGSVDSKTMVAMIGPRRSEKLKSVSTSPGCGLAIDVGR